MKIITIVLLCLMACENRAEKTKLTVINGVNEFELSSTPKYKNAVTLLESAVLTNKGDGFYRSARVAIFKDGKIAEFDRKNGTELSVFGKNGNGPNEINGQGSIFTIENNLVWNNRTKMILFDINGNVLNEVSGAMGSTPIFKDTYFYFENDADIFSRFTKKTFDFKLNKLEEISNPNYVERSQRTVEETPTADESIKGTLESPMYKTFYLDKKIQAYQNNYRFEIKNSDNDIESKYTRSFNRLKYKGAKSLFIISIPGNPKEEKRLKAVYEMATLKHTGGYKSDIVGISGMVDHFLFLVTSGMKDDFEYIDVIDLKTNEYYTSLKIKVDNIQRFMGYTWRNINIQNGKLYITMSNDEIGLYVKIYDIII